MDKLTLVDMPLDILCRLYGQLTAQERCTFQSLSRYFDSVAQEFKTEPKWGTYRRYPRDLAWVDGPVLHDEVWAFWEACTLKHAAWSSRTTDSLLRYKLGLFAIDWTVQGSIQSDGNLHPIQTYIAPLDHVHSVPATRFLDFILYSAFVDPTLEQFAIDLLVTPLAGDFVDSDQLLGALKTTITRKSSDRPGLLEYSSAYDMVHLSPDAQVADDEFQSKVSDPVKSYLRAVADWALPQMQAARSEYKKIEQDMADISTRLRESHNLMQGGVTCDDRAVDELKIRRTAMYTRSGELNAVLAKTTPLYILACQWLNRVEMIQTAIPLVERDYARANALADHAATSSAEFAVLRRALSVSHFCDTQRTSVLLEHRIMIWSVVAATVMLPELQAHGGLRAHYIRMQNSLGPNQDVLHTVAHYYPLHIDSASHSVLFESVLRLYDANRVNTLHREWQGRAAHFDEKRAMIVRFTDHLAAMQKSLIECMQVTTTLFVIQHELTQSVAENIRRFAVEHATANAAVQDKPVQDRGGLDWLNSVYAQMNITQPRLISSSIPECVLLDCRAIPYVEYSNLGLPKWWKVWSATPESAQNHAVKIDANPNTQVLQKLRLLLEPCSILKWWIPDYADCGLWKTFVKGVCQRAEMAASYAPYIDALHGVGYDSSMPIDQRSIAVCHARQKPPHLPTSRTARVWWLYAHLEHYAGETVYIKLKYWYYNLLEQKFVRTGHAMYGKAQDYASMVPVTFLPRQVYYPSNSPELRNYVEEEAEAPRLVYTPDYMVGIRSTPAHFVPLSQWAPAAYDANSKHKLLYTPLFRTPCAKDAWIGCTVGGEPNPAVSFYMANDSLMQYIRE